MKIGRAGLLAGAAALLLGLRMGPNEEPQPLQNIVVRGEGVCGTAGPVGRYGLEWTVVNPKVNGETTILSATESGVYDGAVNFSPNPVPPGGNATASDGPVSGTTKGVVTLDVEYVTAGGIGGQATGELYLEGNCRVPGS